MTWRYCESHVTHALPIGVSTRTALGERVSAGDVIAAGTTFGSPVRVQAARRLGVAVQDLVRVMRVPEGAELERGAIIARTGRRFARAVSAPIDGRIVHVRADGDIDLAPVVDRWSVRATIDGVVTRSTDAEITIEGSAWSLQGIAAYGPDAIGELALGVDAAADELQPSRVDVRQRGRILVGGGRSGAESIARAHACGVAAVVTGAVPAGGLRALFGDEVGARGRSLATDAPTVLCLLGFGSAQLPAQVFAPFAAFAGVRAAIHTASARLFVFAGGDAKQAAGMTPSLSLVADWGAIRPLDGPATLADEARFASEVRAAAVGTPDGPLPAANVLPVDAAR